MKYTFDVVYTYEIVADTKEDAIRRLKHKHPRPHRTREHEGMRLQEIQHLLIEREPGMTSAQEV